MLPNHSTLSACSMLNRNLKQEGEGCIFGGIPAKVIKKQVFRFGLNELDKYVCNFFRDNKEKEACPLPINITTDDLTYKDYK